MPKSERFPEWRDEQQASSYPFEDTATRMTLTGESFDKDTFVDASLYPPGAELQTRITSIVVDADKLTIYIGDTIDPQRCFAQFDWTSDETQIRVTDVHARACGVLISEALRLSVFQGWGLGSYAFADDAARFAATVVCPAVNSGVQGFLLDDGNLVHGDVYLAGDNGVFLECVAVDQNDECGLAQTIQAVRVHAIGDPLFLRRLCSPNLFSVPTFLQTIVFQHGDDSIEIGPGEDGNVIIAQAPVISEDTILRIAQEGSQIRMYVVGERIGEAE